VERGLSAVAEHELFLATAVVTVANRTCLRMQHSLPVPSDSHLTPPSTDLRTFRSEAHGNSSIII
jgi:hypothetical protein